MQTGFTISLWSLGLMAVPLLAALGCGKDNPGAGGSGGAGTAGSGGSSGSGGARGTGGAMVGSGGTDGGSGGSGGSGADADGGSAGCLSPPVTGSPIISDFAMATMPVANSPVGSMDVWQAGQQGMVTVVSGEMHAQSMGNGLNGVLAGVAPPSHCLDLTAQAKYMGVEFKVRSATNTSLDFVALTPEGQFSKSFTVGAADAVVMVPFASLVKVSTTVATLPANYQPAAHLSAIGFRVRTAGEAMDVYLNDIAFY